KEPLLLETEVGSTCMSIESHTASLKLNLPKEVKPLPSLKKISSLSTKKSKANNKDKDASLQEQKKALIDFFGTYSNPSNWIEKETEGNITKYVLRFWTREPIKARMAYLYAMTLYLGQIVGVDKRCITYAFQSQVETLAEEFGLILQTLNYHDDDKLWKYVFSFFFNTTQYFKHISRFVGTRTKTKSNMDLERSSVLLTPNREDPRGSFNLRFASECGTSHEVGMSKGVSFADQDLDKIQDIQISLKPVPISERGILSPSTKPSLPSKAVHFTHSSYQVPSVSSDTTTTTTTTAAAANVATTATTATTTTNTTTTTTTITAAAPTSTTNATTTATTVNGGDMAVHTTSS
ncbi:hypothetical protein RFI_11138, partial [Reticulomyxa filosa]